MPNKREMIEQEQAQHKQEMPIVESLNSQVRITNCNPILLKYEIVLLHFGVKNPVASLSEHDKESKLDVKKVDLLPLHVCRMCLYETKNKTTLLYHVVSQHLKLAPFRCTVCPSASGSYTNAAQHMRRAHNMALEDLNLTFLCSSCKAEFVAPLNLLDHFLEEHADNSPDNVMRVMRYIDDVGNGRKIDIADTSRFGKRRRKRRYE